MSRYGTRAASAAEVGQIYPDPPGGSAPAEATEAQAQTSTTSLTPRAAAGAPPPAAGAPQTPAAGAPQTPALGTLLPSPRAAAPAPAGDIDAIVRAFAADPTALQQLFALAAQQPPPPQAPDPGHALGQAEAVTQDLIVFQQRAAAERQRLEEDHRRQLAATEAELKSLREQYDHLALRHDGPRNGVTDVDRIGAPAATCAFAGCPRRPWPGHPFCGKQHAALAGRAAHGVGGGPLGVGGGPGTGGSVFGDDPDDGILEPPAIVPGNFGDPDLSSEFIGLSKEWVRWMEMHKDKARKFSKEEWKLLGALQHSGRIALSMGAHVDYIQEQMPPDSDAAAVLHDLGGAVAALLETLQRSVDSYALRWTHSQQRYEAFVNYASLYESQAAGPRCMHPGNLALQQQVALVDLRQAKSTLARAREGGGRSADGGRARQRPAAGAGAHTDGAQPRTTHGRGGGATGSARRGGGAAGAAPAAQ